MSIYDSLLAKAINGGGGSGGGGAVTITDNGTALDKTYAEIYDLVNGGTPCYIKYNQVGSESDLDEDYTYKVALFSVALVYKYGDNYRIMAVSSGQETVHNKYYIGVPGVWTYQASSSSDYPTFLRQVYVSDAYLWAGDDRDI